MQRSRKTLEKFAVAIGGLIIMAGMIMLGTSAIAFFDIFDPNFFLNEEIRVILFWVLLILGIIDLISGIILWSGE